MLQEKPPAPTESKYKWPEKRRLLGTKIQRLDGAAKSTGIAKYSSDINRKGMLHAAVLRSPHAHCKIKSIDVTEASKSKGVKALVSVGQVLATPMKGGPAGWETPIAKADTGRELFYQGDEILAIAADTEELALDAVRKVKIEYEVLKHMVNEDVALKNPKDAATTPGMDATNIMVGGKRTAGEVDEALKQADAVVDGEYGVAVQTHVCFETHGLVSEWEGDSLTVWCSTQAVPGTATDLQTFFTQHNVPAKVRCITHHMGSGYGSKFGADIQGRLGAVLARQAKAPVKLFLDRAEEHLAGGNRPSATAKVKIGGKKDGTIVAWTSETWGTPGIGRAAGVNLQLLPYVYNIPALNCVNSIVRLNTGNARAMRAPGHPQNCFITESAIDDLCAKLNLNPLEVRLKNLPTDLKGPIYLKEIEIARKLSEWDMKWHAPGKAAGVVKHGIGMALHTWGGAGRADNDVFVSISSDGGVQVQSSTQDLGTGQRTVLAIVVAETLGLDVKDPQILIGESQIGRSTGSGGSTTCPGTAPAALNAASDARDKLFAKIAMKLDAKQDNLTIEPGHVVDKESKKKWTWKEACARLGMDTVRGEGNWTPGLSNVSVGGVQIAEVLVDTETGVVRCTKIVAVQDCGLIVNLLGCQSQTAGGVIMGLNYALFEERIMDDNTGRMVNPDLEFYKLGGLKDMPEIVVHMHDMPERGVIGIGEPPTIGTAAAIGNAIHNAIGVRVHHSPFTPDRVLAALAKGRA